MSQDSVLSVTENVIVIKWQRKVIWFTGFTYGTHTAVLSEKIYMLFTGWEVRIGTNCARGLEYRQQAQFLPIRPTSRWITYIYFQPILRWITFLFFWPRPVNNIFIFFLLSYKSFRKIFLQSPTYVSWSRTRSCWWSARSIANQNKTLQHDF